MYCGSLFVCQPSGTIRARPVISSPELWLRQECGKTQELEQGSQIPTLSRPYRETRAGTLPRHQTFWLAGSSE